MAALQILPVNTESQQKRGKMKRKSISAHPFNTMCVQPLFLIGTYDDNGRANFAPVTWLSKTYEGPDDLIIISLSGTKKTKNNIKKNGCLSANLVSVDMLPLVDYLGSVSGCNGYKDELEYTYSEGKIVKVPTLDASRWVYELEVAQIVTIGDSDTFFCRIRNVQIDDSIDDTSDGVNLLTIDPVIYSGHYHALGKHLGKIGDFLR